MPARQGMALARPPEILLPYAGHRVAPVSDRFQPRRSMKILDLTTDAATIAIADIAQQKLRESPYYFLKNLTCQFNEGVLTLHGDVPIFPLKHLAESIVGRIEGIHEIINCVEVVDPTLAYTTHRAVRNAG
jgi:hypothetical protein